MKSELNDYKITNGGGVIKSNNDGKIRFDNDNPHYIKENSLLTQNETFTETETFDLKNKVNNSKQEQSNNVSNSTTSTASSTVASSTSAISSSLGTLVGGVVSSVATAVMVVVAFVSIMTINISLVLAGTSSLVFKLEFQNAQEQDFETSIYATLEGNGYSQTQEIFADSVYLTFEDLEAGKEYTITVRNEEKIFVQKSFFTATKDNEKVFIEAWNEDNIVYALVSCRNLKSSDYYTLTATDSSGKVLFKSSGSELEKEYSFVYDKFDTLAFTLSINGKVCCFQQLSMYFEPEYNFENGAWEWSSDYTSASISFPEIHGGEALVITAEIEIISDEYDCEEPGSVTYYASVLINDELYSDERVVETEAVGHDYGEPVFTWTEIGDGYSAVAVFTCLNNRNHTLTLEANVEIDEGYVESLRYVATVELNGQIYTDYFSGSDYVNEPEYDFENGIWEWSNDYLTAYISFPEIHGGESLTYEAFVQEYETPASCEEMGSIVYTASIYVEEADEMFSDEQVVDIKPTDHDYGEPVFEWSQNGNDEPTAIAIFTCRNDSNHVLRMQAEVSMEYSGDQTLQYVATVTYNGVTYEDIYEAIEEDEGVEINLNEGQIYISADGYARQESGLSNPTEFISSANNPYLIQEQTIYGCDNIINVCQTDSSIQTADIYIKLKNVTIEASSWCSLFRIMATNNLNIHLIIEGSVSFAGGSGQQIFSSQGSNSPTVSIIIDQTSFGGTFNADITDGLTYAQSGTINVSYV